MSTREELIIQAYQMLREMKGRQVTMLATHRQIEQQTADQITKLEALLSELKAEL